MNLIQAFKKFGERITTYIDGVMPKALSEIENDLYYPESKEFLCKITTSNCTYTYDGGDVCIGSHSCDLTEDVVEAINKIGDTYSLYIEYTYNGISGVFNNLTNPDDIYCLLGETSADGCLMLKPRTSGGFYFSQERYQTTAMPFIFSIYLVKNAKTIDSDCVDTTIPRINAAEVGQLVSVKSTDANGVPTEWESVDNFSGSWNDLTDKPFYSEEQETWLLDKMELVYEDTNVRYARISVEAFDVFDVVGNIIKVFWDGTYYDCEILYDETNDHKYVVFDNFTAYLEADTLYITTTDNISETHEFGFFIVDEQLKLDENFIPDIIARTEDIPTEMVMYSEQELTEEQQEQVRANIGAASMTEFSALSEEITESLTEKEASGTADSKVSEHNTSETSHSDIRLLIEGLTTRLNALADSDDTTLDQMSEVVAYIKSNKTLIEAITTNKVSVSDIVDNLTTSASNKPLSAKQGVALKALIDAIVVPKKTSQLTNDSGFLTEHQDISGLAPKATTLSGYGITDGATKEQFNQLSEEIENQQKEIDELKESGTGGTVIVEPMEDDIPKVYFTGTLPTSKGEGDLPVTIHYISKTENFKYYATLKVQGDSSTSYPKKNFTLKMYEDKALENKAKYAFRNWGNLNKFVLKAHWIDHSHVRNVGTSKMWGKIVKSRSDYESLPEELRNAPNNGATDGFTCKVFANGIYQGLYEWIVPKDKIFGQDRDNPNHSIMNSEKNNQDTCAFATTSPVMSYWSEELQDSMSSAISTSFSNFIKFVAGSTDEEFVANAENYFDVQSVIDFDIFARVFCIADNLCKNQIFFTYDGVKWYEGAWDMDGVLGLPPTGRAWFTYDTAFQTGYVAYLDYGITNMLYERVEKLFLDRFVTRYNQLRESVLSVANIIDVYDRLTDVIKTYDGLLEEDFAETTGGGEFTGIPYTNENNIQQIRNFIAQRVLYMDEVIANMGSGEEPDTPVEPEVALSSISATYTGGDVVVGTSVNSLTGITVVAHYSDGSTSNVTGYTLSGTIAEGTNTITVSYGGKTTTFVVVGIEESSNAGILEGVSWHSGYIGGNPSGNLGVIGDSAIDIYSDAFDVSNLSHIYVTLSATNNALNSARIVFWSDANASGRETCTGRIEATNSHTLMDGDVPDGSTHARISINNSDKHFKGVTIRETSDGEIVGYSEYTA